MHRARFAQCAWFARSLAIASLVFMSFATQATATLPKPFVATYAVTFRGLNAGTLRMEFRQDSSPQRYVLETRASPSALASFVVSSAAFERTILEVTPDGLRPVQWELDDGKSGNKGDGQLTFNWTDLTVSGSYEGQPVKLALEPGMQDRLSIQLGAMTSLLQGHEPGTIAMVNGDNIRHYTYTRGKTETVQSKLGALDTVVYESTRPNSNRISRVWHAPSLEFIAARAEQIRKGKVETVMTLVELTHGQ
ncbi:hypothetical protein HNQ60_000263 [Povalibacter uvarum]|uniref:DUF3108 domain-containing protein n=1 Tax=Povalibacter uvarum TaxID=732238 RepID=A0A841HEX2_9GAMM|nr:DUF3108 domain-containing protein [Povalibacter uvarum]MBB6091417.1 hypothetical protein [Povalibacter uvarum]